MAQDFYFKAYYSWGCAFEGLNDAELASLTRAIWKYADGKEPQPVVGSAKVAWPMIQDVIRRDKADRVNGGLGGRPKKAKENPPFTENRIENQEHRTDIEKQSNHPTVEEMTAYVRENHLEVNAQEFYDTMERQGWRDNAGKPINVWQAVLRSWAKAPKPVPAQAYSTQRPNTEQELEARIQEL